MLSISLLLVVAAFVVAIASAMGKAPLWVAVLLTILVLLLQLLPIR